MADTTARYRGRGPRGWLRRAFGPAPARSQPPAGDPGGAPRLLAISPDAGAIADLARRLEEDLPDLEVVTGPDAPPAPPGTPPEPGRRAATRRHAGRAATLVLWHGPVGPDPLLDTLLGGGAPVIAVDVPPPGPDAAHRRRAWRRGLAALARILARDEAAARALRQVGPAGLRIEVAGRFVPVPQPPACSESERDHYAQVLHARPVWLAACPDDAELPALLEAHRVALQGAHRLLMLLVPCDDAQGGPLAARLRREGWRVARHGAGEEPDEGTEIFVADSRDEMGLWYRLSPIALLGGSLRPGAPGIADPADPARLGSAILCGPHAEPHAALVGRLERSGGLARVADAGALGPALSDLLAPDRAARLAQSAWDVASDGARVQERIVATIRDVLREQSARGPE